MLARKSADVISVTVANGTDAYVAGDQVGVAVRIPNALEDTRGTALLKSLVVIDGDSEEAALDILFFSEEPVNTEVDNDAADISDEEMAAKFLGLVHVTADDYVTLTSNSVATIRAQDLLLKATKAGSKDLWMLVVVQATPTFTNASSIQIKVGLEKN